MMTSALTCLLLFVTSGVSKRRQHFLVQTTKERAPRGEAGIEKRS